VRKDVGENMLNDWHYHQEIEILYIKKSVGTWIIGDHIGHFQSGDIVIIGANIPHCFRHEYEYIIKKEEVAGEAICVKFAPEIFGNAFLSLPETKAIKNLFSKSARGIQLKGKIKQQASSTIDKMVNGSAVKKLSYLLSMLAEISESKEVSLLSSTGFVQTAVNPDHERIKLIFEYTFTHYSEKITIGEIASLLKMTRQSFCRYFKSKTRKTYVQFLMEVRIGHACRLLVENEKNVAEISYDCGYFNISHFNHQFKMITKKKPLEYKRKYIMYS
jgi:AraC-like DNA-binding protein